MQPIDYEIREKIIESEGNIVVSASAGTGKTYTTIQKIKYEIDKGHAYRTFAAITFTRKAAKEINNKAGINKSEGFIGTNDNFVLKEIIYPFMHDVYGREYKKELKPDFSNEKQIKDFDEGIKKIKDTGFVCKYSDNKKNFSFQLALNILKNSEAARLYMKAKYYRIYIDEYQDSDRDMHNLFMYICKELEIPLFIVGDLKQSIYGWRGGYVEGFRCILRDSEFHRYELKHNFRSVMAIQNYANIFMDDVRVDFRKINFHREVCCFAYKKIKYALAKLKNWINNNEGCAFLIRKKSDAIKWTEYMKNEGLSFMYIPNSPLDNSDLESEHIWISRQIASYILNDLYSEFDFYDEIPNSDAYNFSRVKRMLQNIENNVDCEEKFKEDCKKLYLFLGYDENERVYNEINVLFDVISDQKYIPTYNSEQYEHIVTTIHGSKGLQYKQVIILADNYNLNNEEDCNLHYVAVTRPEQRLLVLCNYTTHNGKLYCKKIVENVKKVRKNEIDAQVSDVAECINSEEFDK
ncbi:UvrD-helicase domain-containing protein [Eubacterium sp.]|uniref:UvrD-helicase domain-containing protein n=1 Tax=Eubacterium sp. TaxID=142586 RepID=UPI00399B7A3D